MNSKNKKYLLIPVPKDPYSRIGPKKWQDWYLQVKRTVKIARRLKHRGADVTIAILSHFKKEGQPSEINIYTEAFQELSPELNVISYRETYDTLGQVERSFSLSEQMGAKLVFISAWEQYPRVRYLARGRKAKHYAVFGIPNYEFLFIDPIAMILQPIVMFLGLGKFFQRILVHERSKHRVL